jgi:ribulose-phosphate 3-epimerase
MITVSPSLLACDFMNIKEEMVLFDGSENVWFHLDVMDGHFVPNLTFGGPIIEQMSSISNIPLDVHLMVNNPFFHIKMLKDLNIYNITFHFEATLLDKIPAMIKFAKQHYPSVGISVKPKTPVEFLTPDILQSIDLVLVMSVEPGFGGQQFIPNTYEQLKDLSELKNKYNPVLQIQVDGGVTNENCSELVKNGAQNLVAGSYIFKNSPDQYLAKVESLRSSDNDIESNGQGEDNE